jgi:N-acetylglucosamine-6-phosphate deacetylase
MSQMSSRSPGVVGAALADRDSYAGIIADGHHVSVDALRVALKAKGAERLFLVSDAMATLNGPDTFNLFGEEIHVDNGRLATGSGTLAGAHLDMAGAVRFMVRKVGATIEEALTAATSTPARFLKLENKVGHIKAGARADFVTLDEQLGVTDVWVAGEKI